MSRWNETITLLSCPNAYQDEEGGYHEGERVGREVFCNPGIIGTMTMAQLRSSEVRINSNDKAPEVGLRDMAMVYVRDIDYEGEDQCIYHGKEMDIIAGTSEREYWKLIVRRRIGND